MKLATFSASIVVPSPKKSVIAVEVFSATRSVFTVSMLVCRLASTPSVWSSALLAVASVSESWPVSEIAWSTSTRCADAAAARFPTACRKRASRDRSPRSRWWFVRRCSPSRTPKRPTRPRGPCRRSYRKARRVTARRSCSTASAVRSPSRGLLCWGRCRPSGQRAPPSGPQPPGSPTP